MKKLKKPLKQRVTRNCERCAKDLSAQQINTGSKAFGGIAFRNPPFITVTLMIEGPSLKAKFGEQIHTYVPDGRKLLICHDVIVNVVQPKEGK